MSLNISGYTDPGAYVGEHVVPGQVSVSALPLTVCLIGTAKRTKRVYNEAVLRGLITNEALVVAATPDAHDATLVNPSNRKSAQMTIYRDGVALDNQYVSILGATITGGTLTTLNFTSNNVFSLSMDGKQPVTIQLNTGAEDSTVITGSFINQTLAGITEAAVTATQIADGINKALGAATDLGYGASYAGVATVGSNKVTLTSPMSLSSASDIKLYAAFPAANSQTAAIFGVSLPYQAPTVVRIANAMYSSTSTYTAEYVALESNTDVLGNSNIQEVVRVGSYAGVTSFRVNSDFTLTGGLSNTLDWSADTAAVLTSSIADATPDLSTRDTINISIDNKQAIDIDLVGLDPAPNGYVVIVDPSNVAIDEVATNINAVLASAAQYGPTYSGVATVVNNKIVLTSPNQGYNGSVVQVGHTGTDAAAADAADATAGTLFRVPAGGVTEARGTGKRPLAGAIYFASYEYTRPLADYNKPKRYFTPDALYSDVGYPSATNKLALAGSICFENKAPSVMVVQVNDANFYGNPSQAELKAALDAAGTTSLATEIVMLDTRVGTAVDVVDHVTSQCSPTEKNYRRGWFGMAKDTAIGDRDTEETFIYRAARTLQVAPDSPGRGRMILVAPSKATRAVILESGLTSNIELDGTFIAAAIAARMTAFTSPSDALLRKMIVGFVADSFPTYLKSERALLASNGVTVVTQDGGQLKLTDPVTTEGAGGRMVTFMEPSASTQKDSISAAVVQAVDANLVGVVPTNINSFILTIKGLIAAVLNGKIAAGDIAPFKSENGMTRDIDMSRDIVVAVDPNDQTKYSFKYYFNLKLPAKRFFGEYSVNNPFFG